MRKTVFSIAAVFFLALCSALLLAAINPEAGTRAGSFLQIGPSARASGFGGAYTAVPGEPASIDWNPSGIAVIPCTQLSATYGNWFADTNYGNFGFAMPAGKHAGLGLSYTYLDYGTLTRVSGQDAYGVPIEDGTFGASDMNLALAYARSFTLFKKPLYAGVAVKTLRLAIDGSSAAGYAGDAGVSYIPCRNTVISVAGRNFGNLNKIDQVQEQLAQETALGASHKFFLGASSLLLAADGVAPIDDYFHLRGGLEYGYKEELFLRAGYRGGYDTDGFTAGAGVAFANMRIDYAYAPFTVLGDTHRVTLTLFIGSGCAKLREPQRLRVTDTGRTTVKLAWDARGNPAGTRYGIIQSKDDFVKNITVAAAPDDNLTGTTAEIFGLSPGTDYWFKARAFGKDGVMPSRYSSSAAGRTLPEALPAVQLSGATVSDSAIQWEWNGVKEAAGYRVYEPKDERLLKELPPNATSWLETSLKEMTTYARIIKVVTPYGEGPASDRAECVTPVSELTADLARLEAETGPIEFKTGKYTIRNEFKRVPDRVSETIKKYPGFTVRLEGHTDNRAPLEYNLKLSRRRAESVKRYLVSKGIPAAAVTTAGFGYGRPAASNSTREGRRVNRRVEFILVAPDGTEIRLKN